MAFDDLDFGALPICLICDFSLQHLDSQKHSSRHLSASNQLKKKKLGSYSWHQIYDNIHSREEIPTIILKADIHRIYQVIYAMKKSKVGDRESWEESFDL